MPPSMSDVLTNVWLHPDRRNVFYSSNAAKTGSERLNALAHWDWTPQPAEYADGASTCMFPLALGCPRRITSEGKEWMNPLITDPAQVKDYEAPDVHSGRTGEVLRNIEAKLKTLPEGRLLRDPDTQSPLGVTELMWGPSFYVDLFEHPNEVHALLSKVTDFITAFIREVQRLAGKRLNAVGFPPVWGPSEGTMLSDDSMSLLSPAMHLEFSVPYLNRIADSVGPLYYHSCTWRAQYFDNIRQIRNCRAYNWNPGNSDAPALIIREFSGAAVLTPHIVIDMHRDNDLLKFGFKDECDLLRYMVDAARDNTCLYFWFSNIIRKAPMIEKMYDFLDERGHTPRAYGFA